jgi:hypothetical protein
VLFDVEADRLTNPSRDERTDSHTDTRASSCKRKLFTKADKVELSMPGLGDANKIQDMNQQEDNVLVLKE